jgi:hypothetical protein
MRAFALLLAFVFAACESQAMPLPDSRDLTATAASGVPANLHNVMQDCIIGGKHGDIVENFANFALLDTNSTQQLQYVQISTLGGTPHRAIDVKQGDRIKAVSVSIYGNGAATMTFTVYKMATDGTLTSMGIGSAAAPAAAWQTLSHTLAVPWDVGAGEVFILHFNSGAGGGAPTRWGNIRITKSRP